MCASARLYRVILVPSQTPPYPLSIYILVQCDSAFVCVCVCLYALNFPFSLSGGMNPVGIVRSFLRKKGFKQIIAL